MPATSVVASEGHTHQEVMVWIEDGEGAIARGVAESVTASGARVRLAEQPGFTQGAEVALRLCFERNAPTVAATARVSFRRCFGRVRAGMDGPGATTQGNGGLAPRSLRHVRGRLRSSATLRAGCATSCSSS
jgi:hypothetical protein